MGMELSKMDSSSGMKTRVIALHDSKTWNDHLEESKKTNKLMLLDFSATWCPPCRFMEPIFNNLAEKYTNIEFIKIDVDELSDVARDLGIEAMPTFVLMRSGKEVERIVGAKKDALEKLIEKHTSQVIVL